MTLGYRGFAPETQNDLIMGILVAIVGVLETIATQRRTPSPKSETLTSETLTPRIETAE